MRVEAVQNPHRQEFSGTVLSNRNFGVVLPSPPLHHHTLPPHNALESEFLCGFALATPPPPPPPPPHSALEWNFCVFCLSFQVLERSQEVRSSPICRTAKKFEFPNKAIQFGSILDVQKTLEVAMKETQLAVQRTSRAREQNLSSLERH